MRADAIILGTAFGYLALLFVVAAWVTGERAGSLYDWFTNGIRTLNRRVLHRLDFLHRLGGCLIVNAKVGPP